MKTAKEFSSQKALRQYLLEHPHADKTKHHVRYPRKTRTKLDENGNRLLKKRDPGEDGTPGNKPEFTSTESKNIPSSKVKNPSVSKPVTKNPSEPESKPKDPFSKPSQKSYQRRYHPHVEQVMDTHSLTDVDADEVRAFKGDRPRRGKKLTDVELLRRFLAKAKPETRERMKNVTPQEFRQMWGAIMEEVGEEDIGMMKSAASSYGLYGFPEKTASLGLKACMDLRHEAGKIASSLHKRKYDKHSSISDFLMKHATEGNCCKSKLLYDSYPDSSLRLASSNEISLEWESDLKASSSDAFEELILSFSSSKKPFTVETLNEINCMTVPVGSGAKYDYLIKVDQDSVNHSPTLTLEEEKSGFKSETVFKVLIPSGKSKDASKILLDLADRLGFEGEVLKVWRKAQTIQ